MATRGLTEVFILMRNNAIQNRHILSDPVADDRMALVSNPASSDVEMGVSFSSGKHPRLPPEWADSVEEVQFEISRIKAKMKELASLHYRHLNTPTLDESIDEEHTIEIRTQEITQIFMRCQRIVQQINAKSQSGSKQERRLTVNIVSSLARSLQELSTNFRKSQSSYLKKVKHREEHTNQFFATAGGFEEEINTDSTFDRGFTDVQLQAVDDNTALVHQRDQEIHHIVRSIQDLNEIFKDIATMVVDQGTILDRIDYNVEQTEVTVEQGLKQLQKAETYQKKNRKMWVILVLAAIIVLMILILIGVKS